MVTVEAPALINSQDSVILPPPNPSFLYRADMRSDLEPVKVPLLEIVNSRPYNPHGIPHVILRGQHNHEACRGGADCDQFFYAIVTENPKAASPLMNKNEQGEVVCRCGCGRPVLLHHLSALFAARIIPQYR